MPDIDEEAGRALQAWRKVRGLSQAQLADAINEAGAVGWFPQTVTKVEAGSRGLKFREGLLLAKVLGVDPADLYEGPTPFPDDLLAQRAIAAMTEASNAVLHHFYVVAKAEIDMFDSEVLGRGGGLSPPVAALVLETRRHYGTDGTVRRVVEMANNWQHLDDPDDSDPHRGPEEPDPDDAPERMR